MRIIIVGLGSMGKRRVRLLQRLDQNMEIIGVDSSKDRIVQAEEQYGIICKENIKAAVKMGNVEAAFVCTSPLSHRVVIKELLENDLNVFTEINLISDGYEELIALAKEKNKVLFLSSTFLYRKDVKAIINEVKNNKVNYVYHTGQYLPDWHPWESFKDFFVADIRTNACREIMAIEFPWLVSCFGDIESVKFVKGDNLTTLEVTYCDNYLITLNHKNGNKGVIAVDIASRKATRKLEIFGEKIHLFWDGTPTSLKKFDIEQKKLVSISTYKEIDKDNRYSESIIENAYLDEIVAFIYEVVSGKKDKTLYSFEEDFDILQWIDIIEYGE